MILGLNKIKKEISILISQNSVLPHMLFSGPRGSGKTTLVKYISAIKKATVFELIGCITRLTLQKTLFEVREGDIIFIDEIHRLRGDVEELLYRPMENFELVIPHYSQAFNLPRFTLIGTTTKVGNISKPLLSRFKVVFEIDSYSLKELAKICKHYFPNYTVRECLEIARCCLVPRDVLNLGFRVYNLLKEYSVAEALEFLGYKYGLSVKERKCLKCLKLQPLGRRVLASILQVDEAELDYIEDKLLRLGLITISNKGRELSYRGQFLLSRWNL